MAESYLPRVNEIIDEEFAQCGVVRRELPERAQAALDSAARRLAGDLETLYQGGYVGRTT